MGRSLGLLVALVVATVALGLGFGAPRTERADFTFVNMSEPKSLDPAVLTGVTGGRIVDAIFEGLTYRDPASLRPTPGVAERWEVSDDGLRWTFHLREDARWSDG